MQNAPATRSDLYHLLAERYPRAQNPGFALFACLLGVAAIAVADYHTGYEMRLAILNLVPIAGATWIHGRSAGLALSSLAVTGWLLSFRSSHVYSHDFYFYWDGAVTVTSFVVFVLLLARLRTALERSDRRFVMVLEGIDAAVLVEAAQDGAIVYSNRRYRESFGEAMPAGLRQMNGPGDAGEFQDAAGERWYFVQTRAVRWTDGREVLLRVLTDITEGKRVSDLMDRHREAVHRTSRLVALGEFASAIAHELNQPLAAIATYSNTSLRLLDAHTTDMAQVREAMDKCRRQAKRAGEIIQRLREFLRHRGPTLGRCDLNTVAREVHQLVSADAAEAGVGLELALAADLVPIVADPVLVEQVVLNLVRNAIEATGPGRPPVRISTSRGDGGAVTCAVTDSGAGVPPETVPRLFDAFVTTKPGGLGLGLSICRSVIEAHGGTITHVPGARGGSVFSFTLPRKVW